MKRTEVDFSKHEVIITREENLLVHYLKRPGTYTYAVKFINTNGIMAVTGDVGNWLFCREFHPSADGSVSDGYWVEKLRNSSEQTGQEYDKEATEREINRMLLGGIEEYGYTKEETVAEYKEYLQECLSLTDDEFAYKHYAYRHTPSWMDSESVIFCTTEPIWLKIVFDAFEEICSRLKAKQEILKPITSENNN